MCAANTNAQKAFMKFWRRPEFFGGVTESDQGRQEALLEQIRLLADAERKRRLSDDEMRRGRELRAEYLRGIFEKMDAYKELQRLLENANTNKMLVAQKVREVRGNILRRPTKALLALGLREYWICDDQSTWDDFADGRDEEDRLPNFDQEPIVHVEKLYHWSPRALWETVIQKQGLLPGLLSGRSDHQYTYVSLEPDDFWHQERRESFGAYVDDSGVDREDFVQLEIDYSSEIQAYMWAHGQTQDESFGLMSRLFYKDTLLSTHLYSLDQLVSELVRNDRKLLQKPGLRTEYPNESDWTFSTLLGERVPYSAMTHSSSWETSEVLLDYVPPEAIRLHKGK